MKSKLLLASVAFVVLSATSIGISQSFDSAATINDPDGYTWIRAGQSTSADRIGKAVDGEVFYTFRQDSTWWKVRTKDGTTGFMHSSRIRLKDDGGASSKAEIVDDGNEWNSIEVARFRQASATMAGASSRFHALVRQVTIQPNGSSEIKFGVTGRYGDGENPERLVERIDRIYSLTWADSSRPIPWYEGQEVRLGVDAKGLVYVYPLDWIVVSKYFRHAANGEVELLVNDGKQWILVRPNFLGYMGNYGVGMDWIRGMGIVMTAYEAGPGDFEVDDFYGKSKGIVPANAPDVRVLPGRDGWRSIESVELNGRVPAEGYIGFYRKLVPALQRIKCAG